MAAAPSGMGGADLVIGIGNPLRGDDGVGWLLLRGLRRLRGQRARQVRRGGRLAPVVRLVPQLVPELVLEMAAARRVLVVDAWCNAGPQARPWLRRLGPAAAEPGPAAGHRLDPGALLTLVALVREEPPPAWLLLLPAYAFPYDTALSAAARRRLPLARQLLRRWLAASPPWGPPIGRPGSLHLLSTSGRQGGLAPRLR